MFGSKQPAKLASDCAEDDLPKRDVNRAEFTRAALLADWQVRSIHLYLLPETPVHKFVEVGGEMLRICDWPEIPAARTKRR